MQRYGPMVAKRIIDEIKEAWSALPPFAQFTVGGSVLGAVGYLIHSTGIGRVIPPGMQYRPPYPRYDDWSRREQGSSGHHGGQYRVGHGHASHAHGHAHP